MKLRLTNENINDFFDLKIVDINRGAYKFYKYKYLGMYLKGYNVPFMTSIKDYEIKKIFGSIDNVSLRVSSKKREIFLCKYDKLGFIKSMKSTRFYADNIELYLNGLIDGTTNPYLYRKDIE